MNKINISVIIPVFNRKNSLKKCLTSLFQDIYQGNHKDVEVIVVDDGSTENLKDCINQFPVSYYRLDKNSGPAISRNFGTSKARGNIIFFIDSDVLLQKGAISHIKNDFKVNKNIIAVQGNYTETPYFTNFFTKYKNSLLYHNFSTYDKKYGTGIATFCVAIKKDGLNEFGGFDENCKTKSIEDEELGIKMYEGGGRILYNNMVQVKHMKKHNLFNLMKEDFIIGFYKIKFHLKNKFFSVKSLEGNHLRIKYLSTIVISNLILLNIILLFFLNNLWIKISFFTLFTLYFLLNLELYYSLMRKGLFFIIKFFLFSFMHNLVIAISILIGFVDFIIKEK